MNSSRVKQCVLPSHYHKGLQQVTVEADKSAKPKEFKKEFKLQWIYDYESTPRRIPQCYINIIGKQDKSDIPLF